MTEQVIFYGAGKWAQENLPQVFFIDLQSPIPASVRILAHGVCFADRDTDKHNAAFLGLPVLPPETALAKFPDAKIYISVDKPLKFSVINILMEEFCISPEWIINREREDWSACWLKDDAAHSKQRRLPIIFYGAGQWSWHSLSHSTVIDGGNAAQSILSYGVCFADKNELKYNGLHHGLPVLPIEIALARFPDAFVFVSLDHPLKSAVCLELVNIYGIPQDRIINYEVFECEVNESDKREKRINIGLSVIRKMAAYLDDNDRSVADLDSGNTVLRLLLKRGVEYYTFDNIKASGMTQKADAVIIGNLDETNADLLEYAAGVAMKKIIIAYVDTENLTVDNVAETFRQHAFILTREEFLEETHFMVFETASAERLCNSMVCTGCGACVSICFAGAIGWGENSEGFYRPVFCIDLCTNCGKCIESCPVQNVVCDNWKKPECYAFSAKNEKRMHSASGGAFRELAEIFIKHGGKVVGAVWDNELKVKMQMINTLDDLYRLLRSKYVQAHSGEIYRQVQEKLENGIKVLFSGLPCQIAGLYAFLGKHHPNLYTADLLCHGAPSPLIFRKFLNETFNEEQVQSFSWRYKDNRLLNQKYSDKIYGNIKAIYDSYGESILQYERSVYFALYGGIDNKHYMIDHSCGYCRFSGFPRQADLTLGDLHGVGLSYHISFDYEYGCSLLLANNARGMELIKEFENLPDKIGFEPVPLEWSFINETRRRHIISPYRNRLFALAKEKSLAEAAEYAIKQKYDVGLVSFCNTPNFGATLNPYALYRALRKLGKEVLMILNPQNCGREWLAEYPQCFRVNPFVEDDFARFNTLAEMRSINDRCEIFIMGSDQTLRLANREGSGKFTDLLWVSDNRKKSAYGASFGEEIFTETESVRAEMAFFLQRFDYLSVREKSGQPLMKNLFNIESDWVIDPVFLLERSEYDALAERGDDLGGNEILAYILDSSENEYKHEILDAVKNQAGFEVSIVKERLTEHIKEERVFCEDLLAAIRASKIVVTDSFHGVCFSIIYRKPFIALANRKRGLTRFTCILELIGLTDRLVFGMPEYDTLKSTLFDINWENIEQRLQPAIAHSWSCLKKAVEPLTALKPLSTYDVIMEKIERFP